MNSPINLMPPIGAPPSADAWNRVLPPQLLGPPIVQGNSRPPGFTYESLGMPIGGEPGMVGSAPDAGLGGSPSPDAWSRVLPPASRPVGFTYPQLMHSAGMTDGPGMIGSAPDAPPGGIAGGGADPSPTPAPPPMPSGNPGGPIIPQSLRDWFHSLYNQDDAHYAPWAGDQYPNAPSNPDNTPTMDPVIVHGAPVAGGHPAGGHPAGGINGGPSGPNPQRGLQIILQNYPNLNNPASIRALQNGASVQSLLGRNQFDSHADNLSLMNSQADGGVANSMARGREEGNMQYALTPGQRLWRNYAEGGLTQSGPVYDPNRRSTTGTHDVASWIRQQLQMAYPRG